MGITSKLGRQFAIWDFFLWLFHLLLYVPSTFFLMSGHFKSDKTTELCAGYFFTDLFDRVVLQMKIRKMVSVVCQPFQYLGGMSEDAYTRWMSGDRPTYQERLLQQVRCTECGL